MREKIAILIKNTEIMSDVNDETWIPEATALTKADQILEAIREEIEKVENPYPNDKLAELNNGFEYCRQKILSLLKE